MQGMNNNDNWSKYNEKAWIFIYSVLYSLTLKIYGFDNNFIREVIANEYTNEYVLLCLKIDFKERKKRKNLYCSFNFPLYFKQVIKINQTYSDYLKEKILETLNKNNYTLNEFVGIDECLSFATKFKNEQLKFNKVQRHRIDFKGNDFHFEVPNLIDEESIDILNEYYKIKSQLINMYDKDVARISDALEDHYKSVELISRQKNEFSFFPYDAYLCLKIFLLLENRKITKQYILQNDIKNVLESERNHGCNKRN